jgi:hypothetical protein
MVVCVVAVASTSGLNANNAAQAALPIPLTLGKNLPLHGFADRMDAVQQDPCNDLGEVRAPGGLLSRNYDIGGRRGRARRRDRTE